MLFYTFNPGKSEVSFPGTLKPFFFFLLISFFALRLHVRDPAQGAEVSGNEFI